MLLGLLAGLLGVACGPSTRSAHAGPEAAPGAEDLRWNAARQRMVTETLAQPTDGRQPIRDPRVLDAMRRVKRHLFVPEPRRNQAYADSPLPIGYDQTISQPYIVAIMTELLGLEPSDVVLEVGTGSGYQAAVLAELVRRVYTIEIVQPLAVRAAADLKAAGYVEVDVRAGDGYKGWPEHAPFDAIIVTAAPEHVPKPLVEQLKVGGRLVLPVGPQGWLGQDLVVLEKQSDGGVKKTAVMPVRFVPLTRLPEEGR